MANHDTQPCPPPCNCLAEVTGRLDRIEAMVTALTATVSLLNNYLHDRQVHGLDRVSAPLPPLFEAVPDDDTPTSPGE